MEDRIRYIEMQLMQERERREKLEYELHAVRSQLDAVMTHLCINADSTPSGTRVPRYTLTSTASESMDPVDATHSSQMNDVGLTEPARTSVAQADNDAAPAATPLNICHRTPTLLSEQNSIKNDTYGPVFAEADVLGNIAAGPMPNEHPSDAYSVLPTASAPTASDDTTSTQLNDMYGSITASLQESDVGVKPNVNADMAGNSAPTSSPADLTRLQQQQTQYANFNTASTIATDEAYSSLPVVEQVAPMHDAYDVLPPVALTTAANAQITNNKTEHSCEANGTGTTTSIKFDENTYGPLDGNFHPSAPAAEPPVPRPHISLDPICAHKSTTTAVTTSTAPSTTGGVVIGAGGVRRWGSIDLVGEGWNKAWQQVCEMPTATTQQVAIRAINSAQISQAFTHVAQETVATLVDDLLKPKEARTMASVNVGGIAGGEKFVKDGIFFKFARDWQGVYGGDAYAMKAASLELLNLRLYLKAAQSSKVPSSHLSTPLAVVIDYGGYRVLASCVLPISGDSSLVYGSADAGRTVHSDIPVVNALMQDAASKLNIKAHVTGTGASKTTLYAPVDIEVHNANDGRFYVLDTARVFPPEAPSSSIQAFLIHAEPIDGSTASAVASAVTILDLSRAKAQQEMQRVLSIMSVHGADGMANQASEGEMLRVELPGAGLYVRKDANPHLAERHGKYPFDAIPVDSHMSLAAVYGCNRVATAILRSVQRIAGSSTTEATGMAPGGLVYGDAVVVAGERGQHLYHCLRPEWVKHFPVPLSSDAFTRFGLDGAAVHNAEVAISTQSLIKNLLPSLALQLQRRAILVSSGRQLVDAIHQLGLNVRHLGMLRVLISTDKSASLQDRTNVRLRSLILGEMVTRVLKQLFREALRSVADISARRDDESARQTRSGNAEDLRMLLLRSCLNRVMAPNGAWSKGPVQLALLSRAAAAARNHPPLRRSTSSSSEPSEIRALADAIWNTVIRTHIQLKFGSQLPALSTEELSTDFDLRTSLSPVSLAAAICEQLGIQVRSDVMNRLLVASSPAMTRCPHRRSGGVVKVHAHDPVLLPRLRLHTLDHARPLALRANTANGSLEHCSAAEDPPEGTVLLRFLLHHKTAVLAARERFSELMKMPSKAESSDLAARRSEFMHLVNAKDDDERYFTETYGKNYSYTNLGMIFDACSRMDSNYHHSSLIEDVHRYKQAGRIWRVTEFRGLEDIAPVNPEELFEPGDIEQLRPVAKPLVTDTAIRDAIEIHPDVSGIEIAVARAHAYMNACWPTFDIYRSSPNAYLTNCVAGLVSEPADAVVPDLCIHPTDTALLRVSPRAAAFVIANVSLFSIVNHQDSAVTVSQISPSSSPSTLQYLEHPFAQSVRSAHSCEIADLLKNPSCVAWDVILHPGYDVYGLQLGVVCTPLKTQRTTFATNAWLLDIGQGVVIMNGVETKRDEILKRRGFTAEAVEQMLKQAFRFFRESTDIPDVVSFVLDTHTGNANIFVNGIDAGLMLYGVTVPVSSQVGVNDAGVSSLHPCGFRSVDGVSKFTICNFRGTNYQLDGCGGAFNVSLQEAATVQSVFRRADVQPLATGGKAQCALTQLLALRDELPAPIRYIGRHGMVGSSSDARPIFDVLAYPADCWARGTSSTAIRSLNRLHLLQEAFSAQSRHCQEAALRAADELATCGNVKFAVDLIAATFSTESGGGRFPQHCVVQAYVLLGDCCLLDEFAPQPLDRWFRAEQWYARALVAILMHIQDPYTRSFIDQLFAVSEGLVSQEIVSSWAKIYSDATLKGTIDMQVHPYAMVILDRLIGVLAAQSRAQHARSFIILFVRLWHLHGCPLPLAALLDSETMGSCRVPLRWYLQTGRKDNTDEREYQQQFPNFGPAGLEMPPWMQNPISTVFGHGLPFAIEMLNEQASAYHGSVSMDKDRRVAPDVDWGAVQSWVGNVSYMNDQGATHDVHAPESLGVFEFGPLPWSYCQKEVGVGTAQANNYPPPPAVQKCFELDSTKSFGGLYQWMDGTEAQVILPLLDDEHVVDVATMHRITLCITSHGRALTWTGDTSTPLSELGLGDATGRAKPFIPYPLRTLFGKRLVQASCGTNFAVLLDDDGTVYTFGNGAGGILGHGDTTSRNTPRAIRALEGIPVGFIVAGPKHIVVASKLPSKSVAPVYTWGNNAHGCCGVGHMDPVMSPAPVWGMYRPSETAGGSPDQPARVTLVDADEACTIALTEDGLLYRFGNFFWAIESCCKNITAPQLVIPQIDVNEDFVPHDGSLIREPAAGGTGDDLCRLSVRGMNIPSTDLYLHTASANMAIVAGDLTVRFKHAAVSKCSLFAISRDGRLFSHGRNDLGQTGHRRIGTGPSLNLTRVAGFGPATRTERSLESKLSHSEISFDAVYTNAPANGAVALAHDQDTSGNVVYSLWQWGDYPTGSSTLEAREANECGGLGTYSLAGHFATPRQMSYPLNRTVPIKKIAARNQNHTMLAVSSNTMECVSMSSAARHAPAREPPLATLVLHPHIVYPGQSFSVEYAVPHNGHQVGDSVVIRSQDSDFVFGAGDALHRVPIMTGPTGSLELTAPGAPGTYVITYFIGLPASAYNGSMVMERWSSRVDALLTVTAAANADANERSVVVEPMNSLVKLDSLGRPSVALSLRFNIVHNSSLRTPLKLPLSEGDVLVLAPMDAFGRLSPFLECGDTERGRLDKPRPPFMSAPYLSGEGFALKREEEFVTFRCTSWNVKDLLKKGTLMTFPAPPTSQVAGIRTACECVLSLECSETLAPGRYSIIYMVPNQQIGVYGNNRRYRGLIPLSQGGFEWFHPSRSLRQRTLFPLGSRPTEAIPPSITAALVNVRIKSGISAVRAASQCRVAVRFWRYGVHWTADDCIGWMTTTNFRAVEENAASMIKRISDAYSREVAGSDLFQRRAWVQAFSQHLMMCQEDVILHARSLVDICHDPSTTFFQADAYSTQRLPREELGVDKEVSLLPTEAVTGNYRATLTLDTPECCGPYVLVLFSRGCTLRLPKIAQDMAPASGAPYFVMACSDKIDVASPTPRPPPPTASQTAAMQEGIPQVPSATTDGMPFPAYEDLPLFLESGVPSTLGMATSGREHDLLLENASWIYRKMYSKNGVPAAMVDGLITTVLTQIKDTPNMALASMIGSLMTQI